LHSHKVDINELQIELERQPSSQQA